MKVQIECNKEEYKKIRQMFEKNGFEICDDAKYLFTEIGFKKRSIIAHDLSGEKHIVKVSDILIIEASDYKNIVKTSSKSLLYVYEKLYYFESNHFSQSLVRVNKSQVVNTKRIIKVSFMVNSKLKLTMENKEIVYVTRTYIKYFKNIFN